MLRSAHAPGVTWLCSRCSRVRPRPVTHVRVVSATLSPGEDDTAPPLPDGAGARKPRGPLSEDTRKRQSQAAKGRVHSVTARELLAAAHTGKKKAFAERPRSKGRVHSAEVRGVGPCGLCQLSSSKMVPQRTYSPHACLFHCTQTRQLMSERVRAACARRKAGVRGSAPPVAPAAVDASQGKDVRELQRALGRTLHEWTTAQLRAAVRVRGQAFCNPGPPKTELFAILQLQLAVAGNNQVLDSILHGREGRGDAESGDAGIDIAAPFPADAAPPALVKEASAASLLAVTQRPAAVPPAPAPAAAPSQPNDKQTKEQAFAAALAEFLDITAAVRPLSSLFGEEILSERGVGFLMAEGNMRDADTVAKFLRLKAEFQKLGE